MPQGRHGREGSTKLGKGEARGRWGGGRDGGLCPLRLPGRETTFAVRKRAQTGMARCAASLAARERACQQRRLLAATLRRCIHLHLCPGRQRAIRGAGCKRALNGQAGPTCTSTRTGEYQPRRRVRGTARCSTDWYLRAAPRAGRAGLEAARQRGRTTRAQHPSAVLRAWQPGSPRQLPGHASSASGARSQHNEGSVVAVLAPRAQQHHLARRAQPGRRVGRSHADAAHAVQGRHARASL